VKEIKIHHPADAYSDDKIKSATATPVFCPPSRSHRRTAGHSRCPVAVPSADDDSPLIFPACLREEETEAFTLGTLAH
jgi:hypothetical protein